MWAHQLSHHFFCHSGLSWKCVQLHRFAHIRQSISSELPFKGKFDYGNYRKHLTGRDPTDRSNIWIEVAIWGWLSRTIKSSPSFTECQPCNHEQVTYLLFGFCLPIWKMSLMPTFLIHCENQMRSRYVLWKLKSFGSITSYLVFSYSYGSCAKLEGIYPLLQQELDRTELPQTTRIAHIF